MCSVECWHYYQMLESQNMAAAPYACIAPSSQPTHCHKFFCCSFKKKQILQTILRIIPLLYLPSHRNKPTVRRSPPLTAKTWRSSWRPPSSSAPPRTGWTLTRRSTSLFVSYAGFRWVYMHIYVCSRPKPSSSFIGHKYHYTYTGWPHVHMQPFPGTWATCSAKQARVFPK